MTDARLDIYEFSARYARLPMDKRLINLGFLNLPEKTMRDVFLELKKIEDRKSLLLRVAEQFFEYKHEKPQKQLL